jgi:hypothetical protein
MVSVVVKLPTTRLVIATANVNLPWAAFQTTPTT